MVYFVFICKDTHTSVSMYSTNKAGSQNSVGFFSIFFFLICHARHVLQHIHLWISMQMTDTLWKTSPRETCLLKLDVVSWLNALETERSQHWFVFTYGIFTWINPGGLFKKKKKHEHTIAAFPLKETECVALRLKLYKDLCWKGSA